MELRETGRLTLGVSIAMAAFAVTAVALRFAAKWKGKVKTGVEDALILIARGSFIAFVGCFLKG
jgi:hypothetical protein